jgi:hypothetical protein
MDQKQKKPGTRHLLVNSPCGDGYKKKKHRGRGRRGCGVASAGLTVNVSFWGFWTQLYDLLWSIISVGPLFFDEKLGHVACFGFNIHGFGFPKATPSSAAQPGVPLKVPRTFPSTPGRSRQADGHGSWNPPSHSKPPRAQRVPIIVFVKVRKSLLMRSLLDFGGKISEFRWSTNHVAAGTQILRMKSAISRSSRSSREWEEVPHFFGTSGWMV